MHPDQKYIQYLISNDPKGIAQIYASFGHKVVDMVRYNSGSEDDGFDILQESLMDIYHLAKDRQFKLTTTFSSFLLLVSKRKWLNEIKKKKRQGVTNADDFVFDVEDASSKELEAHLQIVEKENMVMELLGTLGERCQEIIRKCMTAPHQEQVAEMLGISYAYLRKKKSECMAQLGKKVKAHPLFNTDRDEK